MALPSHMVAACGIVAVTVLLTARPICGVRTGEGAVGQGVAILTLTAPCAGVAPMARGGGDRDKQQYVSNKGFVM